ncbi:hypothetical protein SBA5_360012 [Candidatus Sulfotelmatomonas gaucii]|uniref:Uncharacterized protein n=1 Tax=Candidatus Sulfuritelmatomonas gaucii TaxID=2043161 RepID=A0A2N9LI09_9BACT|nr:hypothetical protein SBA5_360012 [Candidatus Sulfotelmatomonas gaucii]
MQRFSQLLTPPSLPNQQLAGKSLVLDGYKKELLAAPHI